MHSQLQHQALKTTSTIKVDATRNGVNGTYSYAMKNGDIKGGVVPTSPTLPTQPTTSTQPTTATQPTAPTQPTTATEPTTAPAQKAHSKRYFKLLWFCIKDSKH